MKTLARLLPFILVLITIPTKAADDQQVDSLKQVMYSSQPDSNRVQAAFRLAWMHMRDDSRFAHECTDVALQIGEQQSDSMIIFRATYYRGLLFRLSGDYQKAIKFLEEALRGYQIHGTEMQTTGALFNLAVVYSQLGDYESSLSYYYRELEINEKNDYQPGVANALNSIAIVNRKMGDLDGAYEKYERALAIFSELDKKWDMANVLSNMGNVHYDRGESEQALEKFRAALSIDIDIDDRWGQAYNLDHIGNVHLDNNELDSAEFYMRAAMEIRKELGLKKELAEAHVALGNVFQKKKQYELSLQQFQIALDSARSIGQIEVQAVAVDRLASSYAQLGDFERAYELQKDYVLLRDSLFSAEQLEVIEEMEARYEVAQKEKQIIETKLELEESKALKRRSEVINYSLGGGAVVLTGIFLLGYRNFRQGRRLNEQKIATLTKEQEIAGIRAMLAGEEKERSRIAKDLHDGLSGLLSAIKLKFEGIRRDTEALEKNENYAGAVSSLDEAVGEVRRIAHNMMPKVLETSGLVIALEDYFDNIRASKTLDIEFVHFGMEQRLEQTTELVLYRIIQELVNNIMRHSGASEAVVQIMKDKNVLHITVEDNGRGFNVGSESSVGLGMSNLESRVNFLRGELNIESSEQRGTSVFIEVVLQKENS